MRILVLSDSHGDVYNAMRVINQNPEIEYIVHLGDGAGDIERAIKTHPEKIFVRVKGNCDVGSSLNAYEVLSIGGRRVYVTHGHSEHVKYGLDFLAYTAREHGADLALYGHTHFQKADYDNGLRMFNPGSVREGYYGMVDITSTGIICLECHI